MQIKRSLRHVNDVACNANGFLLGSCQFSIRKQQGYGSFILFSLFMQYIFPIFVVMIFVPLIIGNMIAVTIIEFLKMINPIFAIFYISLTFTDGSIVIAMFLLSFISLVIYWSALYRMCGTFSVLPFVAWIVSIFIFFLPLVGPVLSIMINLFPFAGIAIIVHRWVYS